MLEPLITIINKKWNRPAFGDTLRVYVGRPSPLGNPYVDGKEGDRKEVIRKYEAWLAAEMVRGREAKQALDMLVETTHDVELECWCAPLPCHADVIKRVVEREREAKVRDRADSGPKPPGFVSERRQPASAEWGGYGKWP